MSTISFLRYRDFLADLQKHEPRPIVRVQGLQEESSSRGEIPIVTILFHVFVAAQPSSGDLLVSRFRIGHCWPYDKDRIERYSNEIDRLVGMLTGDLTQLGFEVRPGVIAGSEEIATLAALDDLVTEGESHATN